MIGLPYLAGGALALAVVTAAAGYFAGDSAGANRVIARDAKAFAKGIAAMEKGRVAIDLLNGRVADAQRDQSTETRTIYHESVRVVAGSPVYRNQCVDAAGVRLLDRAATNANRGLAGEPAGDAARIAPDAAQS